MKTTEKAEGRRKGRAALVGLAIEAINFMVIDFVLVSAALSLKSSAVSILFMASLVWLFDRFYRAVNEVTGRKWLSWAIITAVVALECVLVLHTGWLRGTLTKW